MIRILVVDDHPVVRAGIVALLGHESDLEVVAEASDGAEAVALAAAHQPDVVLMDLRMPGVDGVEATARIADGRAGAPQVLVLTTYETDDQILAAIEAGASGYLLKASPAAEILAGVRSVAAGRSVLAPEMVAQLVARARFDAAPKPTLTPRETEVLALVAAGLSNPEIAARLGVSVSMVRKYIAQALLACCGNA